MGEPPALSTLIADPPGRGRGTCRNSRFNYLRGAAGNQQAGRGCGYTGLGRLGVRGGDGGQQGLSLAGLYPPQPPAPLQPPHAPTLRAPLPPPLQERHSPMLLNAPPPPQSRSPCWGPSQLCTPLQPPPRPQPPAQYAAWSLWALGRNSSFHTSFPAAAAAEPPAVSIPPLAAPHPIPSVPAPRLAPGLPGAAHVPLAVTPCPLGTVPLLPSPYTQH